MYVVRRAFRGPHGPVAVGSVIEPTDIRMFKYHLQEKHIVEVTEQNLERYAVLFRDRFGLDLHALIACEEAKAAKAAEYFNFPDGNSTSIEVVQEAVEKAEAKAAEAKVEEEAKAEAVKPESKAATVVKQATTKVSASK